MFSFGTGDVINFAPFWDIQILGHRIAILRMRTREEEKKPPQFPVEINGLINYKNQT